MSANFYYISYDPSTTDTSRLHKIIDSQGFNTWWHYLKSGYIIKTTKHNLADIHEILQKDWPGNRYLIIKLDPRYRNGLLAPDAWAWFKRNVK